MTQLTERETELWERQLGRTLSIFGHRNWIVVADAAYPSQSNPGIETIVTSDDHIELLGKILQAINSSRHIRANVYLDAELAMVPEEDAPGVTELREELRPMLGSETRVLNHEQIIAKLDESAKLFNILVLKSTLTIPYTSVFLELDCAYWNAGAEKRLRASLANSDAATLRR